MYDILTFTNIFRVLLSRWCRRFFIQRNSVLCQWSSLDAREAPVSISQRLVQNLAHIWVNLLGIVRLQNIDLQLIIYWHRGHFLR